MKTRGQHLSKLVHWTIVMSKIVRYNFRMGLHAYTFSHPALSLPVYLLQPSISKFLCILSLFHAEYWKRGASFYYIFFIIYFIRSFFIEIFWYRFSMPDPFVYFHSVKKENERYFFLTIVLTAALLLRVLQQYRRTWKNDSKIKELKVEKNDYSILQSSKFVKKKCRKKYLLWLQMLGSSGFLISLERKTKKTC